MLETKHSLDFIGKKQKKRSFKQKRRSLVQKSGGMRKLQTQLVAERRQQKESKALEVKPVERLQSAKREMAVQSNLD